jgi:hypothetical protein
MPGRYRGVSEDAREEDSWHLRDKLPTGITWVKGLVLQGEFVVFCPKCKQRHLCKYYNSYRCLASGCGFEVSARCIDCGIDIPRFKLRCEYHKRERLRELQVFYKPTLELQKQITAERRHEQNEAARDRAIAKLKLTYSQLFDQ